MFSSTGVSVRGTDSGTMVVLAVGFARAVGTELKFGAVTVTRGRVTWFSGIVE